MILLNGQCHKEHDRTGIKTNKNKQTNRQKFVIKAECSLVVHQYFPILQSWHRVWGSFGLILFLQACILSLKNHYWNKMFCTLLVADSYFLFDDDTMGVQI